MSCMKIAGVKISARLVGASIATAEATSNFMLTRYFSRFRFSDGGFLYQQVYARPRAITSGCSAGPAQRWGAGSIFAQSSCMLTATQPSVELVNRYLPDAQVLRLR